MFPDSIKKNVFTQLNKTSRLTSVPRRRSYDSFRKQKKKKKNYIEHE